MYLTLRDALEITPLNKGKLITGQAGLGNRIDAVTVLEIPDATEFLQPNLLTLTSFYAITDNIEKQKEVITLLVKNGISGLLLFNIGRNKGLSGISDELIKLCDDLNFPLITMPLSVSYYDVLEVIINELSNRQVDKLKTSIQVYKAFIDQLLSPENGYSDLLLTLSNLLDKEILFFNHNSTFVFSSKNKNIAKEKKLLKEIKQYLPRNIEDLSKESLCTLENHIVFIIPVQSSSLYYGSIAIIDPEEELTEVMRLAIDQTINALSLSLLSNVRREDFQKRMQKAFIKDLLTNCIGEESSLIDQAEQLGLSKIISAKELAVIRPYHYQSCANNNFNKYNSSTEIHELIKQYFPEEIIVKISNCTLVIIHTSSDNIKLSDKMRNLIYKSNDLNLPLRIAIGPEVTSLSSIHDVYEKSLFSLEFSECWEIKDPLISFEDLDIFYILLQNLDRNSAKKVSERTLQPIRDYDYLNGTELEKTLWILIKNNFSVNATAEELYIHRNTVLQRKNRILELLDKSDLSAVARYKFILACLLNKTIEH